MRKTYIDNIRWITVVLVVIYHVIYMFNGVTTYGVIGPFSENQPQDAFQYVVYPWFMFLLFVVSGMSARFELEKKTTKEFVKSRTVKLLVPSTIGLFVFFWILGYYNMLMGGAFDTMGELPGAILYLIMSISGTGPLWYIQMLWVFSILLVLLRKIIKDKLYNLGKKTPVWLLPVFAVAVWGFAQILNTPVVVVYRFGIYGFGFFAGYLIFSHDEIMDKLGKYWIPYSAAAPVCAVAFVIMYWGQSYPDHEVLDTFVCNLYAWFGTLGVLAFMKRWGGFENKFSKWMCKQSWGLYIFHYLPLAVTAWYLHVFCPDMAPVAVYLLVAAAAFGGSFILFAVISRVPVLRWCVLGIRKKREANNEFRG